MFVKEDQTLLKKETLAKLFSCEFGEIFKVTYVFNLKLVFTEWFFYNLVIQIKLHKMRYLNLDKALLFPRKQVICLKNWKLWRAPTTIKFNHFCWNFVHVSDLTMSTKGCSGFFLFCLDLEFLITMQKKQCVDTRYFWFLQIT